MADEREFGLQILSPETKLYDGKAQFVSAPGIMGELGVLANHAPLLARLQLGEVFVRGPEGEATLVIGGGFIEVHHNQVVLLVEDAVHSSSLVLEEIQERVSRFAEELSSKREHERDVKMEVALKRALIELKVAQGRLG